MADRSVTDAVAEAARRTPDKVALRFFEDLDSPEDLTYAALRQAVGDLVEHLDRSGTGRAVVLAVDPGPAFAICAIAIMASGRVVVPTYAPTSRWALRDPDRGRAIAVASRAGTCLRSERAGNLATVGLPHVSLVETGVDADPCLGAAEPSALYQFSSGTTGAPRGVDVGRANLAANVGAVLAASGFEHDDRWVTWLPMFHDMGFVAGLCAPLVAGGTVIATTPERFVRQPALWLRAISEFGGTHSAAPDFAFRRCTDRITDLETEGVDLHRWRVAISGAEPVRSSTLERFGARFASVGFDVAAFRPSYGLAEATLAVTSGPWNGSTDPLDCGPTVQGTRVVIVDPVTDAIVPDGVEGEILVQGPGVARGYVSDPDATRDRFGIYIGPDADGPFVRTGDLGRLVHGRLAVVGRLVDAISFRGREVAAEAIEQLAATVLPGRAVCAVVADPASGRPVLVCEAAPDWAWGAELEQGVRRAVIAGCGVVLDRVAIVDRGAIPRTPTGKVQRRELTRQASLLGVG